MIVINNDYYTDNVNDIIDNSNYMEMLMRMQNVINQFLFKR